MAPYLDPHLAEISYALDVSALLEKRGCAAEKRAVDARIMEMVKGAQVGEIIEQALKGLAISAGAAIPAVLAGKYLLDRAAGHSQEQSEAMWEHINRAALGAAGIGAGLYALNKMTSTPEKAEDDWKQASVNDSEVIADGFQKMATIMDVDAALNALPKSLSVQATKLAEDVRALNNSYLVTILREFEGK
jgi:hypothetical protein